MYVCILYIISSSALVLPVHGNPYKYSLVTCVLGGVISTCVRGGVRCVLVSGVSAQEVWPRACSSSRVSSRKPRRYLCGSPPVASLTRRRAPQSARLDA